MPRTVETLVYEIDELPERAKENARFWYRTNCLNHQWYDHIYRHFDTICQMLGITLRTTNVTLISGRTREDPNIYFSGFSCQGDGACFEANYCHARDAPRRLREYAAADTTLHQIADRLHAAQRPNFYQLTAEIRQRGRHFHEYSMAIDVDRNSPTYQPPTAQADSAVTESMRDLARWLYGRLENEYDHLTSESAVDDAIAQNDWTFTTEGERFG